nr:thioredoxin family protein [uncultured Psychroserpens sp.]
MKKILLIFFIVPIQLIAQIEITDKETELYVGVENTGLTMIEFYSNNCKFCKIMEPIYKKLSSKYKDQGKFYRLNIDNHKDVYYGLNGTPTYMVYNNTERLFVKDGAMSFNKLEAIFLAGVMKDVIKSSTVNETKKKITSKEILFKAWSFVEKNLSDGLTKVQIGTDNIELNAKKIERINNVNVGLTNGINVKIGIVEYEIIDNPHQFSFTDSEELITEIKSEYDDAESGTIFTDFDSVMSKIEDGIIVKISHYDDLFEGIIKKYLCFGIIENSGEYHCFGLALEFPE